MTYDKVYVGDDDTSNLTRVSIIGQDGVILCFVMLTIFIFKGIQFRRKRVKEKNKDPLS